MSTDDSTPAEPHEDLDVEAEHKKLDELHKRIDDTRHHAEEDMEPGGKGRVFADEGVRIQVERDGDTTHGRAD